MNHNPIKRIINLVTVLLLLIASNQGTKAQEYLRVYSSAPGTMISNVTGSTLITENFSSFSVPNTNWAPLPGGYTSALGKYYQTLGQSYVKNDDQYGSGTGKYMSIKVGGKVRLDFNDPKLYFGFAWPAGDGQNTIKIIRNGQVIGTFATSNVIAQLPNNASNFVTAINGSSYSTNLYYGKPGTGQNSGEPYAYLHFVASSGLAFDAIEFSMGAGGEFENDNHTILQTGAPVLQGDWVELISIFAPTAIDDSGNGLPGNPVTIDVLGNDTPGDAALVPGTVQIDGTSAAGASLVVAGEGTWSVNAITGAITFTPQAGFTGSPGPIQYFVRDLNNIGSNLATVTVTYPVGPTANDDSANTNLNTAVDINVLTNDIPGDSALDPGTVTFVSGTTPDPLTEGTFTADLLTGLVTFTPVFGFTGQVTVDYQVCDLLALCDIATIVVNVNTVAGPTANDDSALTTINTPVDINVLTNDTPGVAALNPTAVSLISATAPNPATEGTFAVDPVSGLVTFTPVTGFLGVVTIDYQVCDFNGLCDIATITVNIIVGLNNLYPALGPGTLAFEDLWPGKGDYDFNDLVIDYQFEIITDIFNNVEEVTATFVLKAFGASFENGFGFQLASGINPEDVTVTGTGLTENIITLNASGTEAGQTRPTIIVFDNAFAHMPHPGTGIGVNTTPGAPYVAPVTFTVKMVFKPDTYSFNNLDISNFNPFLIVNKVRSHEVHLPGYAPTDLFDVSLFGQYEDKSDPATGKYFVTALNHPWAINIYESFDYPIEKQDILSVHLKFAEWAVSGGVQFPDWYKNLSGYRNQSLIYEIPTNP